jgi:hypothetical protein
MSGVDMKGNRMARKISKIIDGLRYSTETATEICTFESGELHGDFHYEETTLYQTPRGRFFLAGYGGALTRWSRPVCDGQADGEGLVPVSARDARSFAEMHAEEDAVARFFEFEEA